MFYKKLKVTESCSSQSTFRMSDNVGIIFPHQQRCLDVLQDYVYSYYQQTQRTLKAQWCVGSAMSAAIGFCKVLLDSWFYIGIVYWSPRNYRKTVSIAYLIAFASLFVFIWNTQTGTIHRRLLYIDAMPRYKGLCWYPIYTGKRASFWSPSRFLFISTANRRWKRW